MRALPKLTIAALVLVPWVHGCNCDDPLARIYPSLVVTPQSAHLTGVPVAQDTEIVFTIVNSKTIDLSKITAVLVADQSDALFSLLPGTPQRVLAGTTGKIVVKIRPPTASTFKAVLLVTAQDDASPDRVEIPIEVDAVDAGLPDIEVTPAQLVFGTVGRLDVARVDVDVKNVGVADLLLDCVYFVPSGDDDVAVRTDHPCPTAADFTDSPIHLTTPIAGVSVAPRNSASLTLNFAPEDVLLHTGELVLLSNDPDESEVRVPVSGTGSECPTAVISYLDGTDEIYAPFDNVRLGGGDSVPVPNSGTFIDAYAWTVQGPAGSSVVVSDDSLQNLELPVDTAGVYSVALHVTDSAGIRSCVAATTQIDVVPAEDLVVQLVWDHPDADLDLHTLREGGQVFTHDGDCYFSNREPVGAPWSDNPDENPNLDHDDDEGYGPENMNIKHPAAGSVHTLAVHYWNAQTDQDPQTTATLRVFAYGQQVIEVSKTFDADQQLWNALEFVWPADPFAPPQISQIGTVEEFVRPF